MSAAPAGVNTLRLRGMDHPEAPTLTTSIVMDRTALPERATDSRAPDKPRRLAL